LGLPALDRGVELEACVTEDAGVVRAALHRQLLRQPVQHRVEEIRQEASVVFVVQVQRRGALDSPAVEQVAVVGERDVGQPSLCQGGDVVAQVGVP